MEKKTQQCTKKKFRKKFTCFSFSFAFLDHNIWLRVYAIFSSVSRPCEECYWFKWKKFTALQFFLLSVLFWFYLNFCVALKVWRLFALLFLSINFELTKWERVNEALHVVVVAVFFFYYWGMCQTGKSGPKCLPMLQKRNKHCCWPFYILRMNVHILRRVKQYKTFNRKKCLWNEKNPSRHTFNGNLFKMGQISRASKNGIMNSFQSRYHRTVTALIPFSTCFSY